MPAKAKPKPEVRTRMRVKAASLVGTNWDKREVSKTIYPMGTEFCHDLSYHLNARHAFIFGPAKPNGIGWTHLVCWPGRGMFVVQIFEEVVK